MRADRALLLSVCMIAAGGLTSAPARADDAVTRCVTSAEEAQRLRNGGRFKDARKELLTCSGSDCPAVLRQDCARWAQEIDGSMPTLTARARDRAGREIVIVRVTIDGVVVAERLDGKPIAIDPGTHVIVYESAQHPTVEETVVARAGEALKPTVTLGAPPETEAREKAASPSKGETRTSPIVWAAGGVAIAGLVTFGVFEPLWRVHYAALEEGCGASRTCSNDAIAPVERELVVARVGLVVGVVGLGVLAWQLLTR